MSNLHPHIADLIAGHVDGVLSEAESAELAAAIERDPSIAAALVEAMKLDATIGAHYRTGRRTPVEPPRTVEAATGWRIGPMVAAIAAALLLATVGVAIYMTALADRTSPTDDRDADSPIATILDTADGSTLTVNDQIANAGDDARPGDYTLDAGSADFRLTNGVAVTLRGDTHLTVHGPMSAALARGTADFDCPPAAKGYTVHLPGGAKVVDLGTRFRVTADDAGDGYVFVSEGKVRTVDAAGENELTVDRAMLVRGGRFVTAGRVLVASFDSDTQPATLEAVGSTPVEFVDGVARFNATAEQGRTYLRTVASDWTARSFTAEVTVRVKDRTAISLAHFGLSDGRVNPGYFFTPTAGPHLSMVLRTDANATVTNNAIDIYDRKADAVATNGGWTRHGVPGGTPAPATYRLIMRWDAATQSATFELDRDADGTVERYVTVDGCDNNFDAANARLVLGGGGGIEFDDLVIIAEDQETPNTQEPATPNGAR